MKELGKQSHAKDDNGIKGKAFSESNVLEIDFGI